MEEWELAFYAYRAAQARMQTAAAYLSLVEWEASVAAGNLLGTAASWTAYTVKVVRAFRRRQQALSQVYLQYARALDISESAGEPLFGGDASRLETYRQAFFDGLQDAATMGTDSPSSWPEDPDWEFVNSELRMSDPAGASENARSASYAEIDLDRHLQEFLDSWGPDKEIEVEEFNWPDLESDANDEAHARYFRELVAAAEKAIEDKVKKRDALQEMLEVEESAEERRTREKAEAAADARTEGNKIAGNVMAATAHAADQNTNWVVRSDRKVRAVARGTAQNPCAFCAILASRGFVYAGDSFGEGNMTLAFRRVHPNCRCYPIVRWVDADQLPELNQRFKDMWNYYKSRNPNDTFNAFRRALYEEQKDGLNAKRRRRYWDRKMMPQ